MNGFDVLRAVGIDIVATPFDEIFGILGQEVQTNEIVRILARMSMVSTPWPVETLAREIGSSLDRHFYFDDDAEVTLRRIRESMDSFRDAERRLVEIISGQPSPDRCRLCRKLWKDHQMFFGETIPEGMIEGQFANGARGLFC